MMRTLTTLALALTLCGTASAAPALADAPATAPAQNLTFDTVLLPQAGQNVEVDGVLQITVSPDGSVNGLYHPVKPGPIDTVVGTLSGTDLQLTIGVASNFHVEGTYDGTSIVGCAYNDHAASSFTASPSPA